MSHQKVSTSRFYGEYHGHRIKDLDVVYQSLRSNSEALIWTAGDSSLDNKYWFQDLRPAVDRYSRILDPPQMNADVTYWINYLCERDANRNHLAAINTAVEATTINERTYKLRPQDIFLRDNLQPQDTLIVSIGGNDVALAPTPCTILSILSLLKCMPLSCVESGKVCWSVPVNDCCCGCGPSLCSCACAFPPCLGYMYHLFKVRIEKYIQMITAKTLPKKILVCMIYYPEEHPTPSWAGPALGALGYNSNPAKLQLMIRKVFTDAISEIQIAGTDVIPVPLFHALNGKNSSDYVARVEPSSQGGRKMAEFLLDSMDHSQSNNHQGDGLAGGGGASGRGMMTGRPPATSYMADRS